MNEKLVEQVARALAVQDGIQICSDASYAQSSYRSRAQAAIAAHSAFIREAALGNYATIEAGRIAAGLAEQRGACRCFTAMLDQIERTPDEG